MSADDAINTADERIKNIKASQDRNDEILDEYTRGDTERVFASLNRIIENEANDLSEFIDVLRPLTTDDTGVSSLESRRQELDNIRNRREQIASGSLASSPLVDLQTDTAEYITQLSRKIQDLIPLLIRLYEIRDELKNAYDAIKRARTET